MKKKLIIEEEVYISPSDKDAISNKNTVSINKRYVDHYVPEDNTGCGCLIWMIMATLLTWLMWNT